MLGLKSGRKRKRGTGDEVKSCFTFIVRNSESPRRALPVGKTCNQKHRELVIQRNHELISAQSDDSLLWIILGKPPTKQNLADEVLFLVHDLLLLPFGKK